MHNVNERTFATTAEAANAQREAANRGAARIGEPIDLTAAELVAEHTGVPSEADHRRFSQAPPTEETVRALLGSIEVVEALGTVLDLSFLVDDVSEDEAAARNLIAAIVASASRVIKSNLG